jgi:hypothetical protein
MTGAEMTDEFRSILRAPDNPVRPLVLEALAAGTPDVTLTDDIAAVMIDIRAMPFERENALAALLKCGQEGEAAVLGAYMRDLSWGASDLQLRAEIIALAYGRLFHAIDVVALLEAIERTDESLRGQLYLWRLADAVPLQDVPAIDYDMPQEELVECAFRFLLRGLGLKNAAIDRYYDPQAIRNIL